MDKLLISLSCMTVFSLGSTFYIYKIYKKQYDQIKADNEEVQRQLEYDQNFDTED